MPHAVLVGARAMATLDRRPLLQENGAIFRVLEVARAPKGWLLKCLIVAPGAQPRRFLARVDERDDGLVAHLDDHMPVERDDATFRFLALIASAILEANPGARVGKTNLERWLGAMPTGSASKT